MWKIKRYSQIDLMTMDKNQFTMIDTCLCNGWFHLLGLFGNQYHVSMKHPNYDIVIRYR